MFWDVPLSVEIHFLLDQPLQVELFLLGPLLFKQDFLLDHQLCKEVFPLDQLVLMLSYLDWGMLVRLLQLIRLLLKKKVRNL